jgi:glycosyltransferase involved in cell wall biosynthesis
MSARNPGLEQVDRIVVVIPAYNEERFIASVVINARQHAHEVIVVDDGSADRTAFLAQEAGAFVIRMPENAGKGGALNAGFEYARRLHPSVVVILDADAQHDPAEIPNVASPILSGEADVVIGSRFLEVKSRIPRWRQLGQHALNLATNVASGVRITDTQSGYRAFSPAALQVMRFRSRGLAVESEMQFLLQSSRLSVKEVAISVQYQDGNKRNPVVHGLRVLDAIIGLAARRRPLLFFALPGILLAAAGLFTGLNVLILIAGHHDLPVGTTMLSVMLMIAGLVLSTAGVTLNVLGGIVDRVRDEVSLGISAARAER